MIDKAGHIVTNYHVIEGADQIEVSFSNQDTLRATLVGSDPSTDIAVLRVEASSRSLTPLVLGNSGIVRVGDPVVAIGNPFGLARTATAGIVSAVQERTITAPNGYPIDHVIQTDAPINSGNSGGPLLNDRAEVIGVNSQIAPAQGSSGNVGIGFAVPSNTVKEVVAQLVATGRVDRAYLGIGGTTVNAELARVFRLPVDAGVLVEVVGDGTRGRACGPEGGHHVDRRRGRGLHARRRPDRRGRRQARRLARRAAGRARRPQARRDGEARDLPRHTGSRRSTSRSAQPSLSRLRRARPLPRRRLRLELRARRRAPQLGVRRRVAAGDQRSLRVARSTPLPAEALLEALRTARPAHGDPLDAPRQRGAREPLLHCACRSSPPAGPGVLAARS